MSAFFLSSCHSVTLKAQNQWMRNFRRIPVPPAVIQSSWRTQEKLLMICMFGDWSPFHFWLSHSFTSLLLKLQRPDMQAANFSLPRIILPGHVPEKLPTGNCSGILGWSQQETNLFLFWANFSLYDSPSVLFWFCRSCAGMSNIPVRAQATEGAVRALTVPNVFWHQQGRLQSSLGWIFIGNNCFTYRRRRLAYYWLG